MGRLVLANSLHSFNVIKSISPLVTILPSHIMETTASVQLQDLLGRLNEAERRAKLLKIEVNNIRQEIVSLQRTVAGNAVTSAQRILQPLKRKAQNKTIILLDSPPDPAASSVDGPTTSKRQAEESDAVENKKTKVAFTMENGYVKVYTDGACENNGRSNARAGIGVWFGDGHPLNISEPVQGRPTNNHAEIKACTEALNTIRENGGDKATIYTDSEFTINCMTKWMGNWKRNHWTTAKGEPVKNKEELQELERATNSLEDVKWVHVRGHRGHKGNEEADRLAREGASRYRPNH